MKKCYTILSLCLFLSLVTQGAWAQFTVTGSVTDASTEEPLISANIFHQPTGRGATTNTNGEFTLELPGESATIRVSFIGYVSQMVDVSASNNQITVALQPDVANLDELVVTGLASSVKRENLANAVASISGDELTESVTPQTLDGALQGKLTGANIVQNSGAPGGGFSIKLRGITTITGASEPLYIVDGVYMNNSAISNGSNTATAASTGGAVASSQDNPPNRIADLNPEDIESVEVLKGASAAAIYGARANAGVIIITTKKGIPGETRVNLSQEIGFQNTLNYVGIRDFTEERVRSTFGDAAAQSFLEAQENGTLTNYEEEVYGETGMIRNSRISLSGGSDKTSFFLAGALQNEDGIIKNTGFERNSIRANIDHTLSDFVDISLNTFYANSEDARGVTNNDNAGVSYGVALTSTLPWVNLFSDENGNYPNNPTAGSNPLQTIALSDISGKTNRFTAGSDISFNLIQEGPSLLQLLLRGGLDYYTNETTLYFPETLQFEQSGATATNGLFSQGNNTVLNTNVSAILLFNYQLNPIEMTSQLGITRLDFEEERETTQAINLVAGQANLEQAGNVNVFNRVLDQQDIGYFFQQEANWNDQVIATAGIRLDQSSLNGDPNTLYAFPKGSIALNLANFDFWSVPQMSQFKLRAAYGESGGIPTPGTVTLQQPKFTVLQAANIDGATGSVINNTLGDDTIKPERSKEFETGVDIGVWDNRVSLTATYYYKKVEDLILTAQIPQSTGFVFQNTNAGELKNEGIELSLDLAPIRRPNFSWTSTTNFWKNRAEITELGVPAFITGGFSTTLGAFKVEEGESPTQIVGRTPESPGTDVKLGDAEPDFQMSFMNRITFLKNFEFSMLWHWKKGGENINLTNLLSDFGGTTFDYDDDSDGDGVTNSTQRINAFFSGDNTTVFIEDAGYVKLREVSLYYTLPQTWTNQIYPGIRNLRLGVAGQNLLLFTDYTGYDPEVSNFGNNGISTGVDVAPFPSSKRFLFSVSLGL